MNYTEQFLAEAGLILESFDRGAIEALATELSNVALRGGRLFILGVGGSAANASHAVNDFRKLCGIEAYAPTDNVSGADGPHQRRRLGVELRVSG